jgi:hypothetical protein
MGGSHPNSPVRLLAGFTSGSLRPLGASSFCNLFCLNGGWGQSAGPTLRAARIAPKSSSAPERWQYDVAPRLRPCRVCGPHVLSGRGILSISSVLPNCTEVRGCQKTTRRLRGSNREAIDQALLSRATSFCIMTDALTLPSVIGPALGSPHTSYLCRSCPIRRRLVLDHPHRRQVLFAFDAWIA